MQLNGHESGEETATTVLVVEDDASLRLLCRLNLELERYRVLEAGTVDLAAELLTQEPVDVVLCLLSGTSETDPPVEEGIDAFVRKPFEIEQLNSTVRRLSTLALER